MPTDEARAIQLRSISVKATENYRGSLPELSAALGMLQIGDLFGWRPLVVVHSKRTIRKYEEILGITVRDFFPEIGPEAKRSLGYLNASRLSNFWKAVSGEVKVDHRQEIQ